MRRRTGNRVTLGARRQHQLPLLGRSTASSRPPPLALALVVRRRAPTPLVELSKPSGIVRNPLSPLRTVLLVVGDLGLAPRFFHALHHTPDGQQPSEIGEGPRDGLFPTTGCQLFPSSQSMPSSLSHTTIPRKPCHAHSRPGYAEGETLPILRERTNAEAAFSTSAHPLPPFPSLPSLPSPPSTNPQPLFPLSPTPKPFSSNLTSATSPAGPRRRQRPPRHPRWTARLPTRCPPSKPKPALAKIWRTFMGTDN